MTVESPTVQLLVVDDSQIITDSVAIALESAGYGVWKANSGKEALEIVKRYGMPHLALIDLTMPGMDGPSLCKRIHQFSDLPIIILTHVDDESVVVELLNKHAEDYINKPFRAAELAARVGRVLRRMGDFAYAMKPRIMIDGHFQLDLPSRTMYIGGVEQSLTPIEAKFLYILIKNQGSTVRTEHLLERIWPGEEAYEDRLHAHVYRLRKKVEADARNPIYIQADWGVGYTFPLMDSDELVRKQSE